MNAKRPFRAPASQGVSKALNEAFARYNRNDLDGALAQCERGVLAKQPRHVEALTLAGVIYYLKKDLQRATQRLEKSIAIQETEDGWFNLALTYAEAGRLGEAERAYRRTVELAPAHSRAWNNLGNIELARHADHAAIEAYRRAIAHSPGYTLAHVNLAEALVRKKDYAAATDHFNKALELNPASIQSFKGLAQIARIKKDFRSAALWRERILGLMPTDPDALAKLLLLRHEMAQWEDFDELLARFIASLGPNASTSPLPLLCWPGITGQVQREVAQAFARKCWGVQLVAPPLVPTDAMEPMEGRPMRIGYLSPDFRNHPVAHLVTEVIEAHSDDVEVTLYSYGPNDGSPERKRLEEAADHFVPLESLDDTEAAQRIAADRIDLLVDLAGYTTLTRPGIAAMRPARIIASWIGYIGSLGEARLADYVIADSHAIPPELESHFSERIARMPLCFQPNPALDSRGPLSTDRARENLPDRAFVFCSFNQDIKLNPPLWDDWCQILLAVPHSVLWLVAPSDPDGKGRLKEEARRRGVDPARIVFCDRKPLAEHRARIALADLALDTHPYNSGTTASDTLGAGVPLLTFSGATFVSRMAGSLLMALGLPELITADRTQYRQRAIELARDPAALGALRDRLQSNCAASPLFQPQRFCRDLEALYLRMIRGEI